MTNAQRDALALIATGTLYVGRDPARPLQGSGFAPGTLRSLEQQGLITRGEYIPLKGRLLQLTDAGQHARAATEEPTP